MIPTRIWVLMWRMKATKKRNTSEWQIIPALSPESDRECLAIIAHARLTFKIHAGEEYCVVPYGIDAISGGTEVITAKKQGKKT